MPNPRAPHLTRFVLVALLGLLAAGACCVHTEPFRDAAGQVLPGSIATLEPIQVGAVTEHVWLRGRSRDDPALILLHGGPGANEAPLFRHYDPALEDHFLVVYWEQRGTGRSYDPDAPPESMTIDRFVRDLDEVVDQIRARFGKDKVVLLGHSWGTAIGTLYAARHPEKVSVYVGVGQIADMPEGELASYTFALSEAGKRGNADAFSELTKIGPPPHSVDAMLTSRKWVERFGGSFHGSLSTGALLWAALGTDEANLWDLVQFGRGNRASLEWLWPELSQLSLRGERRFAMPVFFLLGRFDWQVPAVVAERYFEDVEAPCKRLVWFEESGHNAPFEEPARFERVLIDQVRPLATGSGACRDTPPSGDRLTLHPPDPRRSP